MKKELLEFEDYKPYLAGILESSGARSGLRSQIAEAIGCHTAYVTKVTKYDTDLSLEQAARLNRFLGHTKEESKYFLLLVQKARAGTQELREHFKELMDEMRSKRLVIQNRLKATESLSEASQAIYYSSWIYSAVHVALSIPKMDNREALSEYLGLSLAQVSEALSFLQSAGLVVVREGRYTKGKVNLHLPTNSPHILRHHSNWRTRAILSLDRDAPEDLHYSAVVTLSRDDTAKVREILIRAIKDSVETIRSSREEEMYCLSADFFAMHRRS
jgi:uncharacterized protein (TIGR02147 family)